MNNTTHQNVMYMHLELYYSACIDSHGQNSLISCNRLTGYHPEASNRKELFEHNKKMVLHDLKQHYNAAPIAEDGNASPHRT